MSNATDIVIEHELQSIDAQQVMELVERMDESLRKAREVVSDLQCSEEAMQGLELDETKRFLTACNAAVKETKAAKRDLKRAWEAPVVTLFAAFDAETEELEDLAQRYTQAKRIKEANLKLYRRNLLQQSYYDLMDGSGLEALAEGVPFESIFQEKWVSAAKSWSQKKAEDEVTAVALRIINDWQALMATEYHDRDMAVATFFATLDLAQVALEDKRRKQAAEDAARLRAAVEEALSATPEPEPQPEPEPEQEPEPATMPAQELHTYVLRVDMNDEQKDALLDFMRSWGIHGRFRKEN